MTFEEYLNSLPTSFVPQYPTSQQLTFAKAYDMAVKDGYQLYLLGARDGKTWLLRRLEEYWKQAPNENH